MKSFIDELWNGNIIPQESGLYKSAEIKKISQKSIAYFEELSQTLTEEQKELLEKLLDSKIEYGTISDNLVFAYAFRLGAKMMLDVMALTDGRIDI